MVMYAGQVVESGTLDQIFYDPQHPYTWGLLGSLTRIDRPRTARLAQIAGQPPSLIAPPQGCHFRPRCPHAFDQVHRGAAARGADRRARAHRPLLAARRSRRGRCGWSRPARSGWRRRRHERRERHGRAEAEAPATGEPILEVEHLVKHFPIKRGILFDKQIGAVQAVDDVSFTVNRGETLGLVGESGCGKSTLSRSILQLIEPTSGSVQLRGPRDHRAQVDQRVAARCARRCR